MQRPDRTQHMCKHAHAYARVIDPSNTKICSYQRDTLYSVYVGIITEAQFIVLKGKKKVLVFQRSRQAEKKQAPYFLLPVPVQPRDQERVPQEILTGVQTRF